MSVHVIKCCIIKQFLFCILFDSHFLVRNALNRRNGVLWWKTHLWFRNFFWFLPLTFLSYYFRYLPYFDVSANRGEGHCAPQAGQSHLYWTAVIFFFGGGDIPQIFQNLYINKSCYLNFLFYNFIQVKEAFNLYFYV